MRSSETLELYSDGARVVAKSLPDEIEIVVVTSGGGKDGDARASEPYGCL